MKEQGPLVRQKARWLRLIGEISVGVMPFALLFTLIVFLGRQNEMIPPLGIFLHPIQGAWMPPDDQLKSFTDEMVLPGLRSQVVVRFDSDRVPHVFAETDDDLYYAQGFIVASDRLWQMEFIARVAAGRLSEIFGPRALEHDKMFVRLGIPEAAAETTELASHDQAAQTALEAYAKGVNAYIATLTDKTLPFEYKLLNYRPEPWEPVKSALLLKFMAYNLSFFNRDLQLSRNQSRLSEQDFNELFPLDLSIPEPIIPRGTTWRFQSAPPPTPSQPFRVQVEQRFPTIPMPNPSNGSNNWAVAGKKSTTGRPIVSNDVHLDYAIPSHWYQMQLVSPNQNVAGATLPGAPGIILGWNRHIAWAVTNAGTDIVDWFDLRFRDQQRHEYLHGGQWRPVISRDHQIKVRGHKPVTVTLLRTHFGPIVYGETEDPPNPIIPKGLAMRWGALNPSNELKAFLLLNHAKNFGECRAAIEEIDTPAQNIICADAGGDIGIFHEGLFPMRWGGQGRMVSNGEDPAFDWQGWISRSELPLSINPSRGFVLSANQAPTDSGYPHYLGGQFEVPYRGMRIAEILSSKTRFSPQDMVEMQGDSLLILARDLVPIFLNRINKGKLSDVETEAVALLEKWDFRVEKESGAAVLFDEWFKRVRIAVWSDQFPSDKNYYVPRAFETARLIQKDPESKWFDRLETDERETLNDLIQVSLHDAIGELRRTLASRPGDWRWLAYQPASFTHFGRIPGLGVDDVQARGHAYTIFANQKKHGPVWKSVVALGPQPEAWAIYPGGQSGHPGSRYYANFLEDWAENRLHRVHYLSDSAAPLKGEMKQFRFVGSEAMQ